MRQLILVIIFTIQLPNITITWAQGDGESNIISTGQFWNEFNFTHAQNGLVYQLDLNYTTSNGPTENLNITHYLAQIGYKASIHHFIKPRLKLTFALGQYKNLDKPELNQSASVEIRPIIQVQHFVVKRRITLYNRLRLENRFIKKSGAEKYSYTPRLRYMPKVFIALNSNTIRKKSYYLILAEEVFANVNAGKLIDFNRVTAGVGYCFTDDLVVELCYANQQFFATNGPREITHALSLTVSINNFLSLIKE